VSICKHQQLINNPCPFPSFPSMLNSPHGKNNRHILSHNGHARTDCGAGRVEIGK